MGSRADGTARANDGGYELEAKIGLERDALTIGAELEHMRQLIHDLRNPVGSVSMAVEMLLGPLREALPCMDPELARRVEGTLVALKESARQLRYLVSDLGAVTDSSGMPPLHPMPTKKNVDALTEVSPKKKRVLASNVIEAKKTEVDLQDLLQRLEILTVTRSSLPALLRVDVLPGLSLFANGPELLRALSNLVENAIEAAAAAAPGPGPWTVDVRAHRRGDQIVVEICNEGEALPEALGTWLAGPGTLDSPSGKGQGLHGLGLKVVRRVVQEMGGELEGKSEAGNTSMRMCFPAPKDTV